MPCVGELHGEPISCHGGDDRSEKANECDNNGRVHAA